MPICIAHVPVVSIRSAEQWKLAILLTCAGEPSLVPPGGWPLLLGAGDQLRVWGFNRLQASLLAPCCGRHTRVQVPRDRVLRYARLHCWPLHLAVTSAATRGQATLENPTFPSACSVLASWHW